MVVVTVTENAQNMKPVHIAHVSYFVHCVRLYTINMLNQLKQNEIILPKDVLSRRRLINVKCLHSIKLSYFLPLDAFFVVI